MRDVPDFYDVLQVEDPEFRDSKALSLALEAILDQTKYHQIVHIAALAALVIAYLRDAPPPHRDHLTNSLLDDIRRKVADA